MIIRVSINSHPSGGIAQIDTAVGSKIKEFLVANNNNLVIKINVYNKR